MVDLRHRNRLAAVSGQPKFLLEILAQTRKLGCVSDRQDTANLGIPLDGVVIAERTLNVGSQGVKLGTHRLEDRHQDHRLLSELTWNAFRKHLIFEYEIPKYEGDLGHPNMYVSIPKAIVDYKIKSLCQHFPTQAEKPWFDDETFRSMMRIRGLECHSPSSYAEGFYCRKIMI